MKFGEARGAAVSRWFLKRVSTLLYEEKHRMYEFASMTAVIFFFSKKSQSIILLFQTSQAYNKPDLSGTPPRINHP